MKISVNILIKTVLVIQLQPWLTLDTRVLNKSRNALSENQYGIYLSIYILLFVNCVLYILHKTYHNLEYAFTHTFPELSLTCDVPQKPPISYHETTRTCRSHQATRPTEVTMGPGKYWKLQTRGKEGQCLQWRLAAEWPLSALGLYLFSHQPKAFDPSLKSRTGRKILYFHDDWQHSLAGRECRGTMKTWPRTSQGPGRTARTRIGKRTTPLLPLGNTLFGVCRKTTLTRIPLYFSFAVSFGGEGEHGYFIILPMYNLYPWWLRG